jgi:hypothetical protein
MTPRYELEPFAGTGREAARIVDELLQNIVAALSRDRRLAESRLRELELIFADPRADAEQPLSENCATVCIPMMWIRSMGSKDERYFRNRPRHYRRARALP